MNEPKHTPGPWSQGKTIGTQQTRRWSEAEVAANDKAERLMVFSNFSCADQGRSRIRVANCERAEDARLMAAAPEMLEALKACAAHIGNMPHPDFVNGGPIDIVYAQALQAIAKAEGRQVDREEPTP